MKPYIFLKAPKTDDPLQWLVHQLKVSQAHVELLFQLGAIYCNGERLYHCPHHWSQQQLRIYKQPLRFDISEYPQLQFENEHYVIVDKPSLLPSVPVASNALENALALTEKTVKQKLYPVHRLDRETQGLLIFAKSKQAVHRMQKLRQQKKLIKTYRCLTEKPVPVGNVFHFLKKAKGKMVISLDNQDKHCHLIVTDSQLKDNFYQSSIRLITGRTHQIRCQLSALNRPIVGDTLYGSLLQRTPFPLIAHRLQCDEFDVFSQYQL